MPIFVGFDLVAGLSPPTSSVKDRSASGAQLTLPQPVTREHPDHRDDQKARLRFTGTT
jgi:hypothetical protein